MPLYFVDIKVDLIDKFAKIYLTHKYFNPSSKVVSTVFKFSKEFFDSFNGFTVEKNGKTFIGAVGKKELSQKKFLFQDGADTPEVKAEDFSPKTEEDYLSLDIGNILPEEYISTTLIYEQVINLSENGQLLLQLSLSLTPKSLATVSLSESVNQPRCFLFWRNLKNSFLWAFVVATFTTRQFLIT